jgi:hypothetical protein
MNPSDEMLTIMTRRKSVRRTVSNTNVSSSENSIVPEKRVVGVEEHMRAEVQLKLVAQIV